MIEGMLTSRNELLMKFHVVVGGGGHVYVYYIYSADCVNEHHTEICAY